MGTSTGHSTSTKGTARDVSAPSKQRVSMRKKAAKKAVSARGATNKTQTDTMRTSAAADGATPSAPASEGQKLSREDRKKLISAARAQGLLPSAHKASGGGGAEIKNSAARRAKAVQPENPNRRRRVRRAVVGAADEEGGPVARLTPAEMRMEEVHQELERFDAVVQAADFAEDPFAAVSRHLTETMTTLKPLTPDVGRLPEDEEEA